MLVPGSRWKVSKEMEYERGGVSSRFTGSALLHAYDEADGSLSGVLCSERGTLSMPDVDLESSRATLCRVDDRLGMLELRFVDDEARAVSRPFATGELVERPDGTYACADLVHPCGPDTYYGEVEFQGDGRRWVERWRVEGPRKRGSIVARYDRVP